MKHVVSLSGGLSSWYAARVVVEAHGPENVTLLFADTLIEDEDLYRFLDDASADLGIHVTRIADGRTPWQVFEDVKFIGNSQRDPCSRILKRELLAKWRKDNCEPDDSLHYVGLGWWEPTRVERLPKAFLPWQVEMPLAAMYGVNPENLKDLSRHHGIKPPRLYDLGFTHNNCGGFCIKGGQAAMARLLRVFPERYAGHESEEKRLREKGIKGTVMKLQRGDKSYAITLEDFRKRVETDPFGFNDKDEGGCGCALPV